MTPEPFVSAEEPRNSCRSIVATCSHWHASALPGPTRWERAPSAHYGFFASPNFRPQCKPK